MKDYAIIYIIFKTQGEKCMDESIGIVVKNYDGKILIIDGDYFIKTKLNNNEDAKDIIKRELKNSIDTDIFKIKRIFKEKLSYMRENITMYLVEVGVFNNEFDFISMDKVLDEVCNFKAKEYYERNVLKYEEYSILVMSIFNIIIAVSFIDIIPNFKNSISLNELWTGLAGLACVYFLFTKYLVDKLTNFTINFSINTKIANIFTTIIMVIYCIRLVINIY